MSVTAWVYFFLAVSVLSLIVALWFTREVIGSDTGTPAMQQIAAAIKQGAKLPEAPLQDRGGPPVPHASPTFAYAQSEHSAAEAKPA